MRIYLRSLAVFYFIGAALHILDLFNLRLIFSEMSPTWKMWIVYLTVGDAIACWGLWYLKKYGEVTFLLIAVSQLIAYGLFRNFFGNQMFLIGFHLITVAIYVALRFKSHTLERV